MGKVITAEIRDRMEYLKKAIKRFDRVNLALIPTPLEELKRLGKQLGGFQIYMKRDDLTGLGMGGNKTRMLEFTMAKALREGADCVIGTASVQSNYCRQLCAAATKLGLDTYLVLKNIRGHRDYIIQGNYYLDILLGAKIQIINPKDWGEHCNIVYQLKEKLISEGRKPYIMRAVNVEDTWLDSLGYANCYLELLEQFEEMNLEIIHLFLTGSDTTQAGLLFAQKFIGKSINIVGIRPSLNDGSSPSAGKEGIYKIITKMAEKLDVKIDLSMEEISLYGDYVGKRYGLASSAGIEAIRLLARTEGVFLDPVYSGKGFSGFLDFIKKGKIRSNEPAVFLHTGGLPSLFAFTDDLLAE
jgi:L-cysteate sulfo-lyase